MTNLWTDSQTICEGWFCKAPTSGIGKSHRRYFKLVKTSTPHRNGKHNSAVLTYYTTDRNKGLRGHYPLGPGSSLWKVDKRGFCLKTEFGTLRATCSSQKTRNTWVKQLSPYTKALKPQEVPLPKSPSISRTTSHDSGKEAPPKRRKLKLTMGMQNAEFSMVNFVIKYEIDVFKKRLTHACEMIAETFQLKFGFVLNKKDFTIVSLKELRDRLVFWNHQHIIAWLYYRPLGNGDVAVAGLVNLLLFDRRVLDQLLDCSKDILQLRSVRVSQIGALYKTLSDQGVFFERESALTRVLGSFSAATTGASDTKGDVVKTISNAVNRDAFVVWYNHIAQGLAPGRYLLLLRKDLHSVERAGVVYAHNFTGYVAKTIVLPCASQEDFVDRLQPPVAAKDSRALHRGIGSPGDCAGVYVIKDYRAFRADNDNYALCDHDGLVGSDEWRAAFPRHHREVGDAGYVSHRFRTLVITQSDYSTKLMDLRAGGDMAVSKHPRTLSRTLYFILGFIFGFLIPVMGARGRLSLFQERVRSWLSQYLRK